LEGNGYIATWAAGHLLELAAPDAYGEYAKWRYADLPIIPQKWKYTALKDKAAQIKIIKELMNRPDVECVIKDLIAVNHSEIFLFLNLLMELYALSGNAPTSKKQILNPYSKPKTNSGAGINCLITPVTARSKSPIVISFLIFRFIFANSL
jgi:hypothetical protein